MLSMCAVAVPRIVLGSWQMLDFWAVLEVTSVRAGCRQVIDVLDIVVENFFRPPKGRLSVVRRIRPAVKLKINDLPMITPAQRHSTRLLQRRYLATGSLTDKAQPRHTASDSVLPVVLAIWPGRPDCSNSLNSQPAGR
jgi:hypothetical protein